MSLRARAANACNALLAPFGAQLVSRADGASALKPWDQQFLDWIADAKAKGQDPNDVGDVAWGGGALDQSLLARRYLNFVTPDSIVLELGPGTGRITRHVISRCREMILADYSQVACDWLAGYLPGKGSYRICKLEEPRFPAVADATVDLVIAHGVFEHVDLDDLICFLEEFHRVLKPEGHVSFNFDNIMTRQGLQWFHRYRGNPGARCIFRFYHPDTVRFVSESVGFGVEEMVTDASRLAHLVVRKAA
jgi:SAM-dependent methyltransferase